MTKVLVGTAGTVIAGVLGIVVTILMKMGWLTTHLNKGTISPFFYDSNI
jgi:hypothetical protein